MWYHFYFFLICNDRFYLKNVLYQDQATEMTVMLRI